MRHGRLIITPDGTLKEVDIIIQYGQTHNTSLTFEDWTDLPDRDGTEAGKLSECDLHEEERHPNEDEAR